MIWEGIFDDIPPQMKILNMVIPNARLQFHFELEHCKPHKGVCHPTKCSVINDIKIFPTVYILSQIFDVIQSDVALQSKSIRIVNYCLPKGRLDTVLACLSFRPSV